MHICILLSELALQITTEPPQGPHHGMKGPHS